MTTKSLSAPSFRMNDGDWVCDDPNCQNVNFARREKCNLCGKERPIDCTQRQSNNSKDKDKDKDKDSDKSKRKLGHEIGKVAAEKSKGLFSADDWQCGRCGNVNWARRSTCNMCNAPKFGDNEERTGLGGGYNEREHVEYVEREESDSEYDDFGRKKKKLRKTSENESNDSSDDKHRTFSTTGCKTSKSNYQKQDIKYNKLKDNESKLSNEEEGNHEEEEDEDDEEEGDVSKYKLDSDDEEEDDDNDEDLSKYDLSDWGNDKE